MNFGFRSNAVETGPQRHAPPGSPSLDSGVLSGSLLPSSAGALDDASGDEWVLFSPRLDPVDELAPLDAAELGGSAHTTPRDADLELPGHNGDGSFIEPAAAAGSAAGRGEARGGDWIERINTWRLEQSHLLFSEFEPRAGTPEAHEPHDRIQFWRRLTRRAAQSIGQYLVWDDHVLDALFAADFTPEPAAAGARTDARAAPAPSHLARAREHGPPGWEQRAMRAARSRAGDEAAGGGFMDMLARILLWRYEQRDAAPPARMSAQRHLELLQDSTVPSMSSAPSAYWSDGWEIGTNTSISTAA